MIGALPGVMGAMMALEAIKLIARAGTPLRGALLVYDALHAETRRIRTAARPDCPVCHGAGARPRMIEIRPVGYIIGWLVLGLGGADAACRFFLDLAERRTRNARAFALASVLSMLVGASVALACAESRRGRPQPPPGLPAHHRRPGRSFPPSPACR